jgi:hypothetical protein
MKLNVIVDLICIHSLWFGIRSRLGQRHGHQNTTWLLICIKIYIRKLYMYIFMKVILKANICIFLWKQFWKQIYLYDFHISKLNDLKVIHNLYFQCLTQTFSKNDF